MAYVASNDADTNSHTDEASNDADTNSHTDDTIPHDSAYAVAS